VQRSWRQARRYRTPGGRLRTHCRTGASGQTWSTRCAARSVMRRPPQLPPHRAQSARRGPRLGQNPRPLHEKATSRSSRQRVHRNRAKPPASPGPPPRGLCAVGWEPPAPEERLALILDEPRQPLAVTQARGLRAERLVVIPHAWYNTDAPRSRGAYAPEGTAMGSPGASPVPAPASRVSGPLHAPRPRRWPFARTPGPARFATRAYRIAPRQAVRHEASDDGTAGSGFGAALSVPGGRMARNLREGLRRGAR